MRRGERVDIKNIIVSVCELQQKIISFTPVKGLPDETKKRK